MQGVEVNGTLIVPARYCGPPTSGNGGYVAGSLAHALGDTTGRAVTVTLRRPPPIETTMELVANDQGMDLTVDGALVAQAGFGANDVQPVEGVPHAAAVEASASYPGFTYHPFPTCFACGTERPDGMRLFPGEVSPSPEGPTRVAAPWTPDQSLAADFHEYDDPAPRACLAATWASLDCVGGWAGDLTERLMVLGRMTAVVDALPVIGEPHVVTGQHRGSEGRKTYTSATLHDSDGRIVGRAEHVWVAVDPAAFNA